MRKGTHEELRLGRGFILFEIGFLSAFRNGDDYDADVLVESKSIARGHRAQSSASPGTTTRADTIPPGGWNSLCLSALFTLSTQHVSTVISGVYRIDSRRLA